MIKHAAIENGSHSIRIHNLFSLYPLALEINPVLNLQYGMKAALHALDIIILLTKIARITADTDLGV